MEPKTAHLQELADTLGPFPAAFGSRSALEIGCGASPYTGALKAAGWSYLGIDASRWAATWTSVKWDVPIITMDWDEWIPTAQHALILAVHVLEHLKDAPAGLAKMVQSLEPHGELWLIVPDDGDPVNADHLWFWTPEALRRTVERSGLDVVGFDVRQIIERERFIYLRARKP